MLLYFHDHRRQDRSRTNYKPLIVSKVTTGGVLFDFGKPSKRENGMNLGSWFVLGFSFTWSSRNRMFEDVIFKNQKDRCGLNTNKRNKPMMNMNRGRIIMWDGALMWRIGGASDTASVAKCVILLLLTIYV